MLLPIVIAACGPRPMSMTGPAPVQPTPSQSVSDSVVAAVLRLIAQRGLPDHRPRSIIYAQTDSDIVSSSSLPVLDSVQFVLLDSVEVQRLANRVGSVNVIRVSRPLVHDDTAQAGADSRVVWRRERIGRMISMSACAFRLRRMNAGWQVDSTLGCIIS